MSTTGDQPAIPPPELMFKVTGGDRADVFVESGRRSVADIDAVLALAPTSIGQGGRVLDFGCGCGRVLRHLAGVDGRTELHGVDTDAEAIDWVRDHLSFVRAAVIDPLPPMPYPDGTFDLVINHSVFSHLPEDYQDAWLAELRRVTRPGAWLELTVHGVHALESLVFMLESAGHDAAGMREELAARGHLYVRNDLFDMGFPAYYQNAYVSPAYVFEHWGAFFEVKALVTRGALGFQDVVLLRRS